MPRLLARVSTRRNAVEDHMRAELERVSEFIADSD
jgi:hypothetical protein